MPFGVMIGLGLLSPICVFCVRVLLPQEKIEKCVRPFLRWSTGLEFFSTFGCSVRVLDFIGLAVCLCFVLKKVSKHYRPFRRWSTGLGLFDPFGCNIWFWTSLALLFFVSVMSLQSKDQLYHDFDILMPPH